jgi:pSer/pThr/pTyr-binding forkhead associated (FHA) protein
MAMDVKLVVANGKFSGKAIRVTGPKFFIGRGEDCNVRPASDLVSRHHCVLILDEDYLAVRDLGSKNGTFVNGQRVRGETPLKDGDHLLIGVLEFVVRTGAEAAKVKPKVETVQEAVARTASASSTEFDVDQWLSEDEVGPESPASAETKTIQVDPAQGAPASEAGPHATPEKPVDEQTRKALANLFSDEENKEESTSGAKKEGDSGKFQKPQAADTRQAAANVLKSLFRRT